ncbi:MAG: hypothetical protein ACI8PY_001023, partial [Oceanospirillaceae bacterium]
RKNDESGKKAGQIQTYSCFDLLNRILLIIISVIVNDKYT